jgi:hypothetical protein
MTTSLYRAILNPSGPNYATWKEIFGANPVPLQSCHSVKANLGEENNVEVYLLNLQAMTLNQRAGLLAIIAQKFKVPVFEVEAEIEKTGFPIRAVDVVVSFDVRAFA